MAQIFFCFSRVRGLRLSRPECSRACRAKTDSRNFIRVCGSSGGAQFSVSPTAGKKQPKQSVCEDDEKAARSHSEHCEEKIRREEFLVVEECERADKHWNGRHRQKKKRHPR